MTHSTQMSSPSATLQLCSELMRRPSVTPLDAHCQTLIAQHLTKLGFHCQHLTFGEGDAVVQNLWAIVGDTGPIFCFAGHTDVVPPGSLEQWHNPPFEPKVVGDYLYGRGAADMKGSLAAMVVACQRFLQNQAPLKGRIAFLLTSDEEGPAKNGTVKVVQWLEQQAIKLTWCLVGEPSSTEVVGDVIKNGRRGSLSGTLTLLGRQGHVAYPHLADNPIHRAMPALSALTQTTWDEGDANFPATSLQISNINGGTGATNVIPGQLKVLFNFRFSTAVTSEQLQQRTVSILSRYDLDYQLDWHLNGQPFLTPTGNLVDATVAAVEKVTARKPVLSTAGGTSDGRFIAPTGAEVIELGPTNATIHQINECTSVRELDQLTDIYYQLLLNLMRGTAQ